MPRSRSIFIQSERVRRFSPRARTAPAARIAPPASSRCSVSVVLPASGWLMIANVRRRDHPLGRQVVDQLAEPRLERRQRRPLRQQPVGGRGELVHLAPVDRRQQRLAGREVAVQGADADLGAARDVLERRVGPSLGEGRLGGGDEVLAVPDGVGARLACAAHVAVAANFVVHRPCKTE
jgi:hypothetical protein